jgi:predicted acyltransferase
MAGLASVVFLLFLFLIDIKKIDVWSKPFLFLGKNALVLFFLSTLIAKLSVYLSFRQTDGTFSSVKMILFKNISAHISAYNASLVYSLLFLSIWIIVAYVLHKRKIIIKI